jgi:hypothetical protein
VLACLAAVLCAAPPSAAATVSVSTAPAFEAAIAGAAPGDVIQLAGVSFPTLTVYGNHFAGAPVRIVGVPGTVVSGIKFRDASNLSIESMQISPINRADITATINIETSSEIALSDLDVDGLGESRGARIDVEASATDVAISGSHFTECGDGGYCLQPGGTGVSITQSTFETCADCDFIRGGGDAVTVDGNTFVQAIQGRCKGAFCNHNDLIQITGGGPWAISDNRFGNHDHGAAAVWMRPGLHNDGKPIHDVSIVSNLFLAAGSTFLYAVRVGDNPGPIGLPTNLSIVNNTILTGRLSGIRLGEGYGLLPEEARPIVANNVLASFSRRNCGFGRFEDNVMEHGPGCSQADERGSAHLDLTGAPTAASALVIDRADPAYAPRTDLLGHARVAAPDIGAIEYLG